MADKMTPVVAKVLPSEKERFYDATSRIGTTPSNAIRMFVSAFNRCGTFPFEMIAPVPDEVPSKRDKTPVSS